MEEYEHLKELADYLLCGPVIALLDSPRNGNRVVSVSSVSQG